MSKFIKSLMFLFSLTLVACGNNNQTGDPTPPLYTCTDGVVTCDEGLVCSKKLSVCLKSCDSNSDCDSTNQYCDDEEHACYNIKSGDAQSETK